MFRPWSVVAIVLFMVNSAAASEAADASASNVRLVEGMIAAINERDLDALDALVADDVVRLSAATAGVRITNLEEFKTFLRADFASVPDSKMTVEPIFANDDHVAVRAIYEGTQSGQMGPFPPSGRFFSLPFIGILAVEGGKISRIWVEWDNLYGLTQLGHIAPPEP